MPSYREGYAQMGSYRAGDALGWIFVLYGDPDSPPAGSVSAWIAAAPAWTPVLMKVEYDPSFVNRFPARGAVRGGEGCLFPSIEADALVAAGIADYA